MKSAFHPVNKGRGDNMVIMELRQLGEIKGNHGTGTEWGAFLKSLILLGFLRIF